MIEIKGDYLIDDAVTAAKAKYAAEMDFVNKMEYPPAKKNIKLFTSTNRF